MTVTDRAIHIAKAALAEAGRPDLADGVHNYHGWPGHRQIIPAHGPDRTLIARAFQLAHHAVGHPATIGYDPIVGAYLEFTP